MPDNSVGRSDRRVGGVDRVTGRLQYVGDIRPDDSLHVKLVTLDCARARIDMIRTDDAAQIEGVRAIVTADDLPQPVPRFGPAVSDRPVLAVGETKFHGEPVAAVAAETIDAAEEAARAVVVEYEELPSVTDIASALADGAPLVQASELRPDDPLRDTNVLKEWNFGWGDVDSARADHIVDNVYAFPMVTHFSIEPHGFIAAPDGDGVKVWSSIQHPYLLQRVLAKVLDFPLSHIRVYAPDPGGGFGGKGYPKFEPLVALLALRTRRSVKLVLTLEETFQAVRRAGARIRMRSGFTSDGTLVFQDVASDFLIGAYTDIATRVTSKSNYLAAGPYRVPDVRIRARSVLSHTPPSTAFRGFGTPQVSWATESQMDEAARQLGIDRVEIRLRNIAKRGEEFVPGDTPADGHWAECVERAADAIGWDEPLEQGRGRGISVGIKASATAGASYSILRLLHDGSVFVLVGTSDMGQGARTLLTQVVSSRLGVGSEDITIVMGDTAAVPFDYSTSASRSTVFMGSSVSVACNSLLEQVRALAAGAFGVPEADVEVEPGRVRLPDRELSIVDVLEAGFGSVGGELIAVGTTRGESDRNHPLGGSPWFYEVNCTATEVEVDEETGEYMIVKHVTVGDVGKAINPQHVEMQDEGAAVMGLGHTMMENLIFDDDSGRIQNLGALDYRIPTSKDVPIELRSLLVENEDGPGPFGSKGAGEGGLLSTSSAVAGALTEATGQVIRDLPLTPERVWRALQERA